MWLIIRNSGGMFHYAALRTLDWTNDIIKTCYNPTRSSPRYFPGVIGADVKQFTSVKDGTGNTIAQKNIIQDDLLVRSRTYPLVVQNNNCNQKPVENANHIKSSSLEYSQSLVSPINIKELLLEGDHFFCHKRSQRLRVGEIVEDGGAPRAW